jgi:hypothetical protein
MSSKRFIVVVSPNGADIEIGAFDTLDEAEAFFGEMADSEKYKDTSIAIIDSEEEN